MKAVMESRESIDLDFGRYLLVLKRHSVKLISIFVITVALAGFATRFQKPSYESEGKLRFRLDQTSTLTGLGKGQGNLTPLVPDDNPLSTEIEVITSNPLLQKTIDTLKLKDETGKPLTVEAFKQQLTVKLVGGTDVLRVSYKDRDPKETAAVVNQLMALYIQNTILSERSEALEARKFIAQQLPETEAAVRQADEALRKFKEQNNVVDLSEEATAAVKVIADLDTQITTAQSELERTNAQSAALQTEVNLTPQEANIVNTLSQSPGVQGILEELQKINRQLAQEESRFSSQNPQIVSLQAKRAELNALLQQQINGLFGSQTKVSPKLLQLQVGQVKETRIEEFLKSEEQRLSLARQLASLYNSRTAYQKRVNNIPQLERTQRELERRLEAAQSTYQTLLKNLQEVQVVKNQGIGNARIIQPAQVPEKPIPSSKLPILAIGVMLGLCLSTATVLFLEIRDKSIKTLKEVRQLFGYPLLGVIPFFGKKASFLHGKAEPTIPEIPTRDKPFSQVSELYRMIQTKLKLQGLDKKLKTIVVTSSVPQEGKSTVSANFSVTLAQLGRRVLLIDADLRHPTQHQIWEISNAAGLSEVIIGKTDLETTVCQVMDNLDVLTAGTMPPNPLAIFDSQGMTALMQEVSDQYDFVIIDTPPLTLAAHTLTLNQMTDGTILVTRPGLVDAKSVNATKEMLEPLERKVLGIVVNGVIHKDESSGYLHQDKNYFTEGKSTISEQAKNYQNRKYIGHF